MKLLVFALHGFLGQQSDWDFLRGEKQKNAFTGTHLLVSDYTKIPGLSPVSGDIEAWGLQFIGWKREVYGERPFVIMGYSQGGRLAMMTLKENSPDCLGGVILSAHLGLSNTEKEKRLKNDQVWAKRFLEDDFSTLVKEWDSQPTLVGKKPSPARAEDDFSRQILAESLLNWSAGLQPDLKEWIKEYPKPILWMSGQDDEKYRIQNGMVEFKNKLSRKTLVPESGHRVLSDNPDFVAAEVSGFLRQFKT